MGGAGVGALSPAGKQTVYSLASDDTHPNVWIASDSLAKSFYSAIMTNLGQISATPNILTNATALQYFSKNITDMQKVTRNAIQVPQLIATTPSQKGPLQTSASGIATKYLCQVPTWKSWSSLLISILVADLVFMQALWRSSPCAQMPG